jgi:hypothetical protein
VSPEIQQQSLEIFSVHQACRKELKLRIDGWFDDLPRALANRVVNTHQRGNPPSAGDFERPPRSA